MMALFKNQIFREWTLCRRQWHKIAHAGLFFLLMMVILPLCLPANTTLLHAIVPGYLWLSVLFALLLSAEGMFQHDHDEGVIELWLLSNQPMSVFMVAKLLVFWFITIVPILLMCPLLGLLFALNSMEIMQLMLGLFLGTPAMLCLCALASVLGMGVRQKSVLMGLIVLPLVIPLIIFGSDVTTTTSPLGILALLLGVSLGSMVLFPWAISGCWRMMVL